MHCWVLFYSTCDAITFAKQRGGVVDVHKVENVGENESYQKVTSSLSQL